MKKQSLSLTQAIRRTAPMLFKAFPFTCLLYIVIAAFIGILGGLMAPANQILYDALTLLTAGGGLNAVFFGAGIVTAAMLLQQGLYTFHGFLFRGVISKKSEGLLTSVVQRKIKELPAQFFEDKERLEDIDKARDGSWMVSVMLTAVNNLIFLQCSFFIMTGIYLWRMRPLLLVVFILVFAPVTLSQLFDAKLWTLLERESAPIRRKLSHYEDCLISRGKIKETRLFGAFGFFRNLYMDTLFLLQKKEWGAHKKIAAISIGLGLFKAVGWVGIMVLLFDSLRNGFISIGAFAAVFAAIGRMFGMFDGMFMQIKWSVTNNLGKIQNFLNLLDMDPQTGNVSETPDMSKGIAAADITFSYPMAERKAVDGVSLNIRAGETIAIVGENGSGKTTLVKLLTGMYRPLSGNVTVGGADTSATEPGALFSRTSAVFQDFQRYALSLAENVALSDYGADGDAAAALKQAGVDTADKATFPDGMETVLQRDFGGVDLSGGQWQRVGIARGLYRRHDFIALDEPTSAIDPIEETRVYKSFKALSKGKTSVLVTHRLGSARIADRIIVMDGGQIAEVGDHESLLKKGGKYKEMWDAQAGGYA